MRIRDIWFDITERFSYEWLALKQSFVLRSKSLQDCFKEGYDARENGVREWNCPYSHRLKYQDKRDEWHRGWRESLADDLGDV